MHHQVTESCTTAKAKTKARVKAKAGAKARVRAKAKARVKAKAKARVKAKAKANWKMENKMNQIKLKGWGMLCVWQIVVIHPHWELKGWGGGVEA